MLYEVGKARRAGNPNRRVFDHVGTVEPKDTDGDGVTDVAVSKDGTVRYATQAYQHLVVPYEPTVPTAVIVGGLGVLGVLAGLLARKVKRRRDRR